MNYPIIITLALTSIALFAHVVGATRQMLTIAPKEISCNTKDEFNLIKRSWKMSMCSFQMVAVDLVALIILLYVIAFTDVLSEEKLVAIGISIFYFFWGLVWLIQLIFLKCSTKDYLILSQWILWFICSCLVFLGAQSL